MVCKNFGAWGVAKINIQESGIWWLIPYSPAINKPSDVFTWGPRAKSACTQPALPAAVLMSFVLPVPGHLPRAARSGVLLRQLWQLRVAGSHR